MNTVEVKLRMERLEAMHNFIMMANDENIYMSWIVLVPDCPSEDDFKFIAEYDEEYKEVCNLFRRLVAKKGWE